MNRLYVGNGYIRVGKCEARKNFLDGKDVILCASNMRVDAGINIKRTNGNVTKLIFEAICNEFHYYNCNKDTGRYLYFYIKESK